MGTPELSLLAAWLCLLLASVVQAAPRQLLKIASLAPEGSDWVQAVRDVDAELRRRTEDAVGLRLYPGGVQGDDPVVLRKMRVGQLQGAGFSGQGIAEIFPDVLAMEVPFLFDTYAEIDYVLEQMDAYYRAGIAAHGYVLLAWSDIGFVHLLSREPVARVADIAGHRVWRLENEPLTQVLFRRAGVTSVPLTIPDVLLGLQTNMVDVVYAPPVAAIVLQWFTRVKYVTSLPINFALGALVISQRAFAALEPEHQSLLLELSRQRMRELNLVTRQANAEAMQVMLNHGLQLVEPTPADVEEFRQLVLASVPEWIGEAYSAEAHAMVQQHLQAVRAGRESDR